MNNEKLNKTKIFGREELREAADSLKQGELVAFPTETVFGLGAIANNNQAVKQVFKTKGRPSDNPLIVHVHNINSVYDYVEEVNDVALKLMETFWPGPLTIIFPVKKGIFAESVTPNQKTVGIRMPNQLEALLLIEMVGFPLVGPSANLSGKPSPTSIEHVIHDFDGKIAGVVNNYSEFTQVGVESTVVWPTAERIEILRPGAITQAMLSKATGIDVSEKSSEEQMKDTTIASPGVKYTHYSPSQPVKMVDPSHSLEEWKDFIKETDLKIGILAQDHIISELQTNNIGFSYYSLGSNEELEQATQRLFAGLRFLESSDCDVIFAQAFEETDETHAYLNRLSKASSSMI